MKFITSSLLIALLSAPLQQALAVTVILDFESAPIGTFNSLTPLQFSDGIGGVWTLTPRATAGTSYSIIDKAGDRELRLTDQGGVPGTFSLDITHSRGLLTPLSGGDYEAGIGLNEGNFDYLWQSTRIFSDINPISTASDTAITFGAQSAAAFTRISGNGLFSSSTDIQVDVDNLVFDVVPEPSSVVLLGLGTFCLLARRRRHC
jgi:hypothetical protein